MTKQDLITLYERVGQVMVAQHNEKPDRVELEDDGSFRCVVERNCGGSYDEDVYYIQFEELTADLDAMVAVRKAEEAERARIAKEEQIEREKRQKEIDKERRRDEYLKLKREFGG